MNLPDVVIGTIMNYGWPEVMTFALSLERSGYSGKKVMFIENISSYAKERLSALGWILKEVIADKSQSYATARHIPVSEFLNENKNNFRYVLYVDVRDAVFQSNPSIWLENNLKTTELVGPSECVLIKDQDVNSRWIKETLGEEIEKFLGEHEVLCCGTIVGGIEPVAYVIEKMCEFSKNISGWGYDQAYFNYLTRISPLKEVTRILKMNEGFIATVSWFLCDAWKWKPFLIDEEPIFDGQNILVRSPGSNEPYPIFHQYDRNYQWKAAVEAKYSEVITI
jgi:hypothetical protein